jgi:BON domain-containing protein
MNKLLVSLASAGTGAGMMYMLDPHEGRRRRARLRKAVVHATRTATAVTTMTSRDVEHRLAGVAARVRHRLAEEPEPIDDVLAERVRARLGRLVSHPGAIEVTASEGTVTLSGPIFQAEVEHVLNGVAAVAGVKAIENRLQAHANAGHGSALQGPGPRHVPQAPAKWFRWTPAGRLVAGMAGLTLLAVASPRRPIRAAGGLAGAELLERAIFGARGSA